MKNAVILLILSIFVLLSCESNSISSPIESNFDPVAAFGTIDIDQADLDLMTNDNLTKGYKGSLLSYEVKMKYFAKGIAKLLNDPEIGTYLRAEIGKQFDGDYDALWEVVAENEFMNKGKFKNILRKLYNTNIDMLEQFNSVPLLQVSTPVHYEKWNVGEPLLVAFNPISVDDVEWEDIIAFDGDGKKYKLNTQSKPNYPVVVIGINERVDPETKVPISTEDSTVGRYGIETNDDMRIEYAKVVNDREPWNKGKPETYYIFDNGNTELYRTYYDYFDADDTSWYYFNKRIMYWSPVDDAPRSYIRWIEHDWHIFGKTWSVNNADFWIDNGMGDDSMGTETFHRDDPTSTTSDPYVTGLGHFKFTITW